MVRCAVPGPVYFNGLPQDLYLYWEAGHEASAAAARPTGSTESSNGKQQRLGSSRTRRAGEMPRQNAKRDTFSGWIC
jgi:hypothetical protein